VSVNGSTFNNASINTIQFDTALADLINNADSASFYEFDTANDGAATFCMNGGAATLNIDFVGAPASLGANDGNDANIGALKVSLSGTEATSAVATINLMSVSDLNEVAISTEVRSPT
jgi:hypothetical protein